MNETDEFKFFYDEKLPDNEIILEADSYLFAIVIFSFLMRSIFALLFSASFVFIYMKSMKKNSNKISFFICIIPYFICLCFSYFLLVAIMMAAILLIGIPGYFVPVVQIFCLSSIAKPNFPDRIIKEGDLIFSIARVLISMVLFIMLYNEISQAINNLCFALDRVVNGAEFNKLYVEYFNKNNDAEGLKSFNGFIPKSLRYIGRMGQIIPGLTQFAIVLVIEFFSIMIIYNSQDSVSLISNFAGLSILLEFDVYVIRFLTKSNIGEFLLKIVINVDKSLNRKKKEDKKPLSAELIILEKKLSMAHLFYRLFTENEIKVPQTKDNKWIFKLRYYLRSVALLALFLMAFAPYWNK